MLNGQMQLREVHRANFTARTENMRKVWAYRAIYSAHPAFLNSIRQVMESFVGDMLEAVAADLPADHPDQKILRKNTLEANISYLRNKGAIDANLFTHMHVIRMCGNLGSHDQGGVTPDPYLVESCDMSMQCFIRWYTALYLENGFDLDAFMKKIPKLVIIDIPKPNEPGGKRKRIGGMMSFVADYGKQLLLTLIGSLLVAWLLNKYGAAILALIGG